MARRCLLVSWLLLAATPAQAHPHIFVDYSASVVPGQLDLLVTLDSMYSVVVRSEVIMNDTERSVQEETVKAKGADLLADSPVYIYLTVDGQTQPPVRLVLLADRQDKDGAYKVAVPLPAGASQVSFAMYDPTYYVSVSLKEGDHAVSDNCQHARETIDQTVWGPLRADRVSCKVAG